MYTSCRIIHTDEACSWLYSIPPSTIPNGNPQNPTRAKRFILKTIL